MDKIKFKKLLFDIACSTMACDYDIDDREIQELKNISESTNYFKGVDLSKRLENFKSKFNENAEETINDFTRKLEGSFLNPVQEMLLLEIVLRIVYADTKIDPHEVEFVNKVRSFLSISDELIKDRFGVIDFLINKQIDIAETKEKQKESLSSTDMENLENLYYGIADKKEKN